MKYCIDEKIASKLGLSLSELFAALLIKNNHSLSNILDELLKKEVIVKTECGYCITQHWNDVVENILLTSDKSVPTDEELDAFADELRMIFPSGKKIGTPYYYRCNHREIVLKLKKFFKLYGNNWSKEEILEATRKYVESMRGNPLMRLSKYFIWKDDDKQGEVSELATLLENMNDDKNEDTGSWTYENWAEKLM